MTSNPEPSAMPAVWVQLLTAPVRFLVTLGVILYTALDELLFPLFRPAIRWLGHLQLFQRLAALIRSLPPYAVLTLLAAPFIILEPAKLFALYWAATGHPTQGALLLLTAQIASILTCDRIFHVGYAPLMRIGWLNRLMTWLIGLRDLALNWAKSTAIWKAAATAARGVRNWFRNLLSPGR